MNWKTWIPLALALVLGLVAAKVARDMMTRTREEAKEKAKGVRVVVSKVPVQPGQALRMEDLVLAPIAAETGPVNAFASPDALAGRAALSPIVPGQPILEDLLAPKDAGRGLQALVPPGMRAVTVQVDETSSIAGLLAPGCYVDVVATIGGGDSDKAVARTIVQNLRVVAVGQRMNAPGQAPPAPPARDGNAGENNGPQAAAAETFRTVTLLATPQQVEAIELASNGSRPRLVMRGGNDERFTQSSGMTLAQLRGKSFATSILDALRQRNAGTPGRELTTPGQAVASAAPKQQQPKPRPKRTVTFIRGGKETNIEVDVPSAGLPGVGPDEIHAGEPADGNGGTPGGSAPGGTAPGESTTPGNSPAWITQTDQGPAAGE